MTAHATTRAAQWNISASEIECVIREGVIIEDSRGHSCLLLGFVCGRPIHACLGIETAPGLCEIITVYEPTLDKWQDDYKTRR